MTHLILLTGAMTAADTADMRLYFEIGAAITVVAYLLGSIPSGYLVGRSRGIDIRQHGSGNIGATNVRRVLGKGPGNFVFACDALKGLLAVVLGKWIASSLRFTTGPWASPTGERLPTDLTSIMFPVAVAALIAGIACILGHNFPVWLKFKGGKGIATSAGVLIGMMPLVVVAALAIWAAVFYSTRYVSLASIVAAISLPVIVLVLLFTGLLTGWPYFYFAIIAAFLAVWRHRSNIQRLIAGTEPRFEKKNAGTATPPEPPPPPSSQ